MNRRSCLKAIAAAAAGPFADFSQAKSKAAAPRSTLETSIVRLHLRHTWTTVMSSSQYRDNLHLRFTRGGVTGRGEAAPIVRYKESAETA